MIPPDREKLIDALNSTIFKKYQQELVTQLDAKYANPKHGNFKDWQIIIELLPEIKPSVLDFSQATPVIGKKSDCTIDVINSLEEKLKSLSPWRKGPFNVFGININSEWRSNLKWSRIAPHLRLNGKHVLDVGSGNGYYALRMQAMGADLVLGIDPTWLYVFQYLALQKYLESEQRAFVLPFSLDELPESISGVDVIFSMGVLYHRQNPKTHLKQVYDRLSSNGELVLETLIIEDQDIEVLIPKERYANMRNVWMIPSPALLETWLKECGFENIRLIDKSYTSIEEQRQTQWSPGYSLGKALNPENPNETIEGYPAPLRAMIMAEKH